MKQLHVLRVVVASPGDVQPERNALLEVAEDLNRSIARGRNLHIEISRWETDSYPGFHIDGPQEWLDQFLDIEDCDLLIGIFWKRFGTPTRDAKSGTEHEFRKAYKSWKSNGHPQIMVYFNQSCYTLTSKGEADQLGRVLQFKHNFPSEGLFCDYNGEDEFKNKVRNHLTQYIMRVTIPDSKSLNSEAITKKPTRISPPIDEQIAQWIQARANSIETTRTYQALITGFRHVLKEHNLDLDSEDESSIRSIFQDWAETATRKTIIKPKTYNQRISSIRSFYKFALTQGWIEINPLEEVSMREEDTVDAAKPIDREKVKKALQSIPRNTLNGKRDYAILCILLTTGVRPAEIAGMRCGNVAKTGNSLIITTRSKGGGNMSYPLQKGTAQALIDCFSATYGDEYAPDKPVWISYARNGTRGYAIGKSALSDICNKWLHTTRVEATKRTYEEIKKEYGDKGLEKIEKLLGIDVEDDELN